jgi:hypothetical protein
MTDADVAAAIRDHVHAFNNRDVDVLMSGFTEPVEFTEPRAVEESIPLCRRELQDRPLRVPAVADTDRTAGQARHLHAVAVGETERTLNPDRVHLLTLRHLAAVRLAAYDCFGILVYRQCSNNIRLYKQQVNLIEI